MSKQITVQRTELDAAHFKEKYGRYPYRLQEVSAYLSRHRNGHKRLDEDELAWMQKKYERVMADVMENNSEESREKARKQAKENRIRIFKTYYHSKRRHTFRISGHSEHNVNSVGDITSEREYCSIFDAFTYVEPGKTEFFYNRAKASTPRYDERLYFEGNTFHSFYAAIGKRWFANGEPQFAVLPDNSQGYQTTRGDIGTLRSTIHDYYPDTITVIPGFLINWAKDRARRGSVIEFPKYNFTKVQTGAFHNIEFKPDLVKLGCTPMEFDNVVEYHILNIEDEHFIYLDQSIEPETTVLIHIPERLRGHYKSPQDLYVELTHPPEVNNKEPYFRHGEWYIVPTNKKTRDLIKCDSGPVEEGSEHEIQEIRGDEDGNKYVRGSMRHNKGDHPVLRLGRKIWYRLFKSRTIGHSADMRGATIRYD